MSNLTFNVEPYPLEFAPESTALLIIDMQRDFLEPGGFGEMLGNDVSLLRSAIEPDRTAPATFRSPDPLFLSVPSPSNVASAFSPR